MNIDYSIEALQKSGFSGIVAQNILKSKRKLATELAVASMRAGAQVAVAKTAARPRTMAVAAEAGTAARKEAGEMTRARMEAGLKREELGKHYGAAEETARLKREEFGLAEEAFEFEKGFLEKKKKKREAGISSVEEIEELVASPRY